MSRRGRGEGSITQLADGRWQARISVRGPSGKPTRKAFYGATWEEAHGKLTLAKAKTLRGLPLPPEVITLGQYLDEWIEDVKPTIRASSWRGYEVNVRLHIKPAIGHIKLARLGPRDVEKMLTALTAKTLAPRTIQYVRVTLRVALQRALAWEYVARNVADLVKGPKVERAPVHPLSPDQVRVFLDGVERDRLRALYVLAFTLGLRQGELLGLRWEDVDLHAGTLRVVQAYQRRGGFGPPKSERSRRTLTLPAMSRAALGRHQAEQERERAAMESKWKDQGLVFATPNGTPLDTSALGRWFRAHVKRLGLPPQRFHDARHACASLLLAQHVDLRVVMEILGHSQISLTANTYQHVMPALHGEAAAGMDAVLGSTAERMASGMASNRNRGGVPRLRVLPDPNLD